jgi:hypothetical protein
VPGRAAAGADTRRRAAWPLLAALICSPRTGQIQSALRRTWPWPDLPPGFVDLCRLAVGPRSLGVEGVPKDAGARTHGVHKGASR